MVDTFERRNAAGMAHVPSHLFMTFPHFDQFMTSSSRIFVLRFDFGSCDE
jgi:hypothetical protein